MPTDHDDPPVTSSRRTGGFLLAAGGWTVFNWVTFARNLSRDENRPVSFYVVHAALIVVNVGLGAALAALGWRAWRAADH